MFSLTRVTTFTTQTPLKASGLDPPVLLQSLTVTPPKAAYNRLARRFDSIELVSILFGISDFPKSIDKSDNLVKSLLNHYRSKSISMDFMTNVPPTLSDLILSLEQATFMAKQLPSSSSADHTHLLQIYTSLHSAHHNLSNFLSLIDFPPRPPPPPPPPATEISFSSATANPETNENEPMEVGDNHDEVEAAEEEISKVQEKMRECFIKNKRPKRPLSPSATAAEERQFGGGGDDGFVGRLRDFDPNATKLKALDLVYQFHG